MVAEPAQRRFTVEEYECMIEAGIFRADERVELLGGRILAMTPMAVPHRMALMRSDRTLKQKLPSTVDILVQMPIRLLPDSEPEPDIAVIRRRADDYPLAHPGPPDIFLVVEVSDSSLAFDRDRKLPRYAAAGIPEAWIVDLRGDRIWLYRVPLSGQYTLVSSVGRGEALSMLAFPDVALAVDDLLPPLMA